MSFKGRILARCPKGCEPEEMDVWSFVRGSDEALRETLLAGELNLILCSECSTPYYPGATVVYADPSAGLVAFVFPESYGAEEGKWRAKMAEDYAAMRGALDADMPLGQGAPPRGREPVLFFGMEGLRQLLRAEEDLEDEVAVASHLARNLGLVLRPVERGFARERGLPRLLPQPAGQGPHPRSATVDALKAVLGANGALAGYSRWLAHLESAAEDPPFA